MRPCNKPVWVQPRICEFCRSLVIQLATAQDNYRGGVVWSVQRGPESLLLGICHLKEKHYLCAVFTGARVGHMVSMGTV